MPISKPRFRRPKRRIRTTARAQTSGAGPEPLPPRVDAGENVDEVLGEVSKLFGQGRRRRSSARSADDDINEALNDLTAAGASAPQVAAPAEPSKEMRLGTAADLFRSSPAEPVEAPVTEALPETTGCRNRRLPR